MTAVDKLMVSFIIKDANNSEEIKEGVKPKTKDEIKGVPKNENNLDETDIEIPTAHNLPKDPEYNTDQIISGTGKGPVL